MGRIYFIVIILIIRYVIVAYGHHFNPKLRRLRQSIPSLLSYYSVYYKNLNNKEKIHFEKRVLTFISLKDFCHFSKSEVTDDMKILISSTAVQGTFGFYDGYGYDAFRKIVILDKEYRSKQTKKIHQGEANPRNALIAFSWKHFMEGIKDPHDSINLGLHEFAHALFINNVKGFQNRHFCESIHEWHAMVLELSKEQPIHDFFRSYAFENKMELFAVSMEYFFENPKDFETHLPQLYRVMCRLLNQNPMLANNGIVRGSSYYHIAQV